MKNTDILKKHFAPYFDKENREKEFLNGYFLTKFKDSINSYCKSVGAKYIGIEDLISYYDYNGVKRDQRRDLTFEEALEKHSDVINKWTPSLGLDVFWLKNLYHEINKEVLSDFYDVFGDELFDEVLKKRHVYINDLVLINLGLIKKLKKEHYKILEEKNLDFFSTKAPNIDVFKKLLVLGDLYKSPIIWENYLNFFKDKYLFVNKVKKLFNSQKREYSFPEQEVNFLQINKYSRSLKINPQTLYGYNENLNKTSIDNVVMALNNILFSVACEIETSANKVEEYLKVGERKIIFEFEKKESIDAFDKYLKNLMPYLKEMVEKTQVTKEKKSDEYFKDFSVFINRYKLNDVLVAKDSKKKLKI